MTGTPLPPASLVPGPAGDFAILEAQIMGQLTKLFTEKAQAQVDAEVAKARQEYSKRLDQQVGALEGEIKGRLIERFRAVGIAVIALFVAAFSLFIWAQTRAVQATFNQYQTSVIDLQREIMAAQNTINGATRELGEKNAQVSAANTELDAARRRLEQTETEYAARLRQLSAANRP